MALATWLTHRFWEPVFQKVPFSLFFLAVAVAAWYGGLGPGLLAGIAAAAASLLIRPWSMVTTYAAVIMLGGAALVSTLMEQRRRTERNLEVEAANRKQAEAVVSAREAELAALTSRLEAERARLAAVLDHLPVGVFLADAETQQITYANAQAKADWNLSARSLPAYGDFHGYHITGEKLTPDEWPFARALRQGELVTGAEIDILAGDTRRVMRVNAAPIRDEAGQVTAAVLSADEITLERRDSVRLELLAGASRLLARPVDASSALQGVADLAVRTLTDWCAFYLPQPDGQIRQVALAHQDPERVELGRMLDRRYPVLPGSGLGVSRVLETGEPLLAPDLTDHHLRAIARDEEHLALLRTLNVRSLMMFPIRSGERVLGVMTLISSETRFRFDAADEGVAADLAARVATALELLRLEEETTASVRALTLSEERYRALAFATSQTVWSTNAEGVAGTELPGWSELTGRPEAETQGSGWLEDVHPDDREAAAETWAHAYHHGEPYEAEYRIRLRSGEYRWFAARGTPVRAQDGTLREWVGTYTDVHERKVLEHALRSSEEQFRHLVEQSPLSVQILDTDGCLMQVNRAWEQLWGITLEELGRHSLLTDPQLERLGITPFLRRALAGEALELPPVGYAPLESLPDIAHDGETRWVRAYAYPIRDVDGEIRRAVLIQEDYSERKRLEEELQQRLEELAEASRHKDQFLSMLAHELRNPLAGVINALYVLAEAPPGSAPAQRALAAAMRQASHQTALVNDLLDVSRIQRGKTRLHAERLDLVPLVAQIAEDQRVSCERAGLELRLDLSPTPVILEADPIRLRQILSNLLDNAAKFTPRGGSICVELEAVPEEGMARLRVTDTGIGIPEELLPRVWDPFRQADASLDRSQGGLGLGLALVKGLAVLHGGSASVSSPGEGKGTTFTITLPLAS